MNIGEFYSIGSFDTQREYYRSNRGIRLALTNDRSFREVLLHGGGFNGPTALTIDRDGLMVELDVTKVDGFDKTLPSITDDKIPLRFDSVGHFVSTFRDFAPTQSQRQLSAGVKAIVDEMDSPDCLNEIIAVGMRVVDQKGRVLSVLLPEEGEVDNRQHPRRLYIAEGGLNLDGRKIVEKRLEMS